MLPCICEVWATSLQVAVVCSATGQQWTFACNQWLHTDQEVTLPCTQTTPPTHSLDEFISHNESARRCPKDVTCEDDESAYDEETFEEDNRSDVEKEYEGSFSSSDSEESPSDTEQEEEEEEESVTRSCEVGPREEPPTAGGMLQGVFRYTECSLRQGSTVSLFLLAQVTS